jgi:hypothetical protein
MSKKRKMNLLEDIKNIVKNDKEHHLKIEVDCLGIRVFLIYDPEDEYNEDAIIPIEYSTCEEFAYISDSDYRKMFKPCDFGFTLDEIILIKNIMEYLESHKKEIKELCNGYSWVDRMEKENE